MRFKEELLTGTGEATQFSSAVRLRDLERFGKYTF